MGKKSLLYSVIGAVILLLATPSLFASVPSSGLLHAQGNPTPTPVAVAELTVVATKELTLIAGPGGRSAYLSPDGTRIAWADREQMCIYTAAGEKQVCAKLTIRAIDPETVRWSPDGRSLVFTEEFLRYFDEPDIWIMDASTGTLTDLTDDQTDKFIIQNMAENKSVDLVPCWSQDGKKILFLRFDFSDPRNPFGAKLLTVAPAGGTPQQAGELTSTQRLAIYTLAWSGDGTKIAYNYFGQGDNKGLSGVWIAELNGENSRQIAKTDPTLSPLWVSFSADARYVLSVTGAGGFAGSFRPEQSPVSAVSVDGSGTQLIDKENYVLVAGWAPTGAGLAYIARNSGQPEKSGLYLAQGPGDPGRLVLPGEFINPLPRQSHLIWAANNTVLLAKQDGKLVLVQLGKE